jgi:hypothetical protein
MILTNDKSGHNHVSETVAGVGFEPTTSGLRAAIREIQLSTLQALELEWPFDFQSNRTCLDTIGLCHPIVLNNARGTRSNF